MTKQNIEDKAKRLFDESVDGLDGATLSRLNRSRQLALAATEQQRPLFLRLAPVGGLAAAAALAVVMLQSPGELAAPDNVSDFEILMSEDSLDMLEELEFFAWMELDESAADDPNT
jgi:hypothetical protein